MRQCAICHKGSIMAGTRHLLRGHYNPTNWTRKYPNLQSIKLPNSKRVLVCTKCRRTLNKVPKKIIIKPATIRVTETAVAK